MLIWNINVKVYILSRIVLKIISESVTTTNTFC